MALGQGILFVKKTGPSKPQCSVEKCENLAQRSGMCDRHHREGYRKNPRCKAIDQKHHKKCEKLADAKGYCRHHYKDYLAGTVKNWTCKECNNFANSKGYCQKHYKQYLRGGL